MTARKNKTSQRLLLLAAAVLGLLCWPLAAQTQPKPDSDTDTEKGEVKDGFVIHQSIEFGGRIADFSGNESMWDTFVNVDSGPRLLNQSLDMHAIDHTGSLFDELHESSSGFGGDPNNLWRLRMGKGRIYDFNVMFRRDRNYWDYDLLANPLNPPPNLAILTSPHRFEVVRRMTDVNLTLAPQSPVRVRLGFARNVSKGPSFSSIHEGTDALTAQFWRNGLDTYRVGLDFRVLPRTTFSYDQFLSVYKGDTVQELNSTIVGTGFSLAGGIPVDLGLVFNAAAGQPCNPAVLGTGFVNPACNGYFAYNRSSPTRNIYPTEQFSFQSNYWRKIDITGRFNYTSADGDVPVYDEFFRGLITRNRTRQFEITGPVSSRRISASADLGVTWHVTDKLDFVDSYRWTDFRSPGSGLQDMSSLFGATLLSNPNVFSPATCPPPFTAATCPQHNASSSADNIILAFNRYLSQNIQFNTVALDYQFTRRFRANLGYRFRHREIDAFAHDFQIQTFFPGPTAALANRGACSPAISHPLNPDGTCTVLVGVADSGSDHIPINEHSLLFGFMLLPWDQFRVTYDMELMYADNAFVRLSPRQLQQYRLRVVYKPVDWANLSASVNIRENRNNTLDIGNLQHNRSYALAAVLSPRSDLSFDLTWNYNDVYSQTNICFVATPNLAPLGSLTCGTPFLSGLSTYSQTAHFVSANVMWKPVKRVTAEVGYTGTFASGNTLILNPFTPTGPLDYTYHLPSASVRVELAPRWTLSGGWNYYGYNEDSFPGPTLSRDFRGNVITTSVKYAF